MALASRQLKIHPKQSPKAVGTVRARHFVLPQRVGVLSFRPLCAFALSRELSLCSLTTASGLTPLSLLHRREGCRDRAVPLPLVLLLLPACLQVLRRCLEAVGGEASLDRRARPHPSSMQRAALSLASPLLLARDGLRQLGVYWASDPAPALWEEARTSAGPSVHPGPPAPPGGQSGWKEGPLASVGGGGSLACFPATLPRWAAFCFASPAAPSSAFPSI